MAAGHGGPRAGAGRPKGAKNTPEIPRTPRVYRDALEYLEAVVRGDEPPDGQRIAAARVVLPFQAPKQRAPIASPTPRKLKQIEARQAERDISEAWSKRSNAVRASLKKEHKP